MHRKAQVVTLLKENEELYVLLMLTQPARGEHWQNVTGSVEDDEDFAEGARRELFEETGLDLPVIPLTLVQTFYDRFERHVREEVFMAILHHRPERIQLCAKEHQAYQWVKFEDLRESHYGFAFHYRATVLAKEQICARS